MDGLWDALGAVGEFIEHHIGALTAILAAAAILQWRETRKTAERQLRAYVMQGSASVIDGTGLDQAFVNRAGQPGLLMDIKNFGQTPAYNLRHWNMMEVSAVHREADIKPPATLSSIAPMVLAPGASSARSRWLERSLSTQEVEGIHNGTYAIYVYGRIEYTDAFGAKRWNIYKLRYSGGAWPPVGNNATLLFCPEGNDAN